MSLQAEWIEIYNAVYNNNVTTLEELITHGVDVNDTTIIVSDNCVM